MTAIETANPVPPDRFTARSIYAPAALALLSGVLLSFEPGFLFLLGPLDLLLVFIWALVMLVLIGRAGMRHQWRRTVSRVAVLICAWPIMWLWLRAGDYIHFAFAYPFYERALEGNPDRYAAPISFQWSASGFAGIAATQRTVVYDSAGGTGEKLGGHETADGSDD